MYLCKNRLLLEPNLETYIADLLEYIFTVQIGSKIDRGVECSQDSVDWIEQQIDVVTKYVYTKSSR